MTGQLGAVSATPRSSGPTIVLGPRPGDLEPVHGSHRSRLNCSDGGRDAIEEIDHPGLQRILGADDEQPFSLDHPLHDS
jgi:hypothetical protein